MRRIFLLGFALAFVAGLLQKVLPMPKRAPDREGCFSKLGAPHCSRFFGVASRTPGGGKETHIRIYPVVSPLQRHVLNSQTTYRRGSLVFLGWCPGGLPSHGVRHPWRAFLLAVTVLLRPEPCAR